MIFAYLDEFGHCGPYFSRTHARHKTSPVFGLAGILMPEEAVRGFAGFFLHRKTELLGHDIEKSGKPAYAWEKKGTNLFTAKSLSKYPEISRTAFRLLNRIDKDRCKIFYCGREKIRNKEDGLNPNGLYKTVLSDAIRQIENYCQTIDQQFIIVIDEHSARPELLETAAKTMYGENKAYLLSSPPFQVESYLNQNIQAADWMATLVGRLWNYKLDPEGFSEYSIYEKFFWDRMHAVATHSTVKRRRHRQLKPPEKMGTFGEVLIAAFSKTEISVEVENEESD